ncbi:MAG: agmatinase family protein [Bdellovibrionales bacterium]|nr:agmatinase family protein [Bdellovibrionales bacterium]
MKPQLFDPNSATTQNGCFLGLDYSIEDAQIIIVQAPWDVTTSYRPGAVYGPDAVIEASYQLDMTSPIRENSWELKISTLSLNQQWLQMSKRLRKDAEKVIQHLQNGKSPDDTEISEALQIVNKGGKTFNSALYHEIKPLLNMANVNDKKIITLGGDHSISFSPIKAHLEKYPNMSVLHIDAHADLRKAFEGFTHSHASIMYNVMEHSDLKKLVQMGIRDVSPSEVDYIGQNPKIETFFDWNLKYDLYSGKPWKDICQKIIDELTDEVYISFDIDGLNPALCPSTGTPVPGGFDLSALSFLFMLIKKSGRTFVGGDLVEVAPSRDGNPWDGNVGARALWLMCTCL